MQFLHDITTAAWALRWLLAAAAFVILGVLYADALVCLSRVHRDLLDRDDKLRRLGVILNARDISAGVNGAAANGKNNRVYSDQGAAK